MPKMQEFRELTRLASDSYPIAGSEQGMFAGKFRKYAARLGDKHYLLKVQDEKAPEMPRVEYLCNQLAKENGLQVPEFFLINIRGTSTFVTKDLVRNQPMAVDL